MRIMIVDGSSTFRAQLRRAFNEQAGLEVSATASGGRTALQMLRQKGIDLLIIDLDISDPDIFEVIKNIRDFDDKITIIACANRDSEKLEQLSSTIKFGADAFFTKPIFDQNYNLELRAIIRDQILKKVKSISDRSNKSLQLSRNTSSIKDQEISSQIRVSKAANDHISYTPSQTLRVVENRPLYKKVDLKNFSPKVIVIASSTGGPSALEAVLSKLPASPLLPILIVQHMPESFTKHLAKRLQDACGVPCREAINGEPIRPGMIYVAPGDFHMRIFGSSNSKMIALDKTEKVNSVRPAADILFVSAAEIYRNQCFGMILTGMGEDGLNGAKKIKEHGGGIMIQSRESCVIWGMPAAVEQFGCYDGVGDLEECAAMLSRYCR